MQHRLHRSGTLSAFATVLVSLLALVLAGSALATHARPKGASPKREALVLAYNDCGAPNVAHNTDAPKAPSCTAPTQKSEWLTVGTPDYNGLAVDFVGFVRLDVCPVSGCAGPDVKLQSNMTGVRCSKSLAVSAKGVCPAAEFGPYTGTVATNIFMKFTDHCNAPVNSPPCPAPPGLPATSVVAVFPVTTPCANPGGGAGGVCQIATTLNAVVAGTIQSGQRMNVESTVAVDDGGSDGNATTTVGNESFATEGFFVP
jgi:hypothetical protein